MGEHTYLGTQAAVKILQTQLTNTDVDTFLIEVRTIARLEHPNIVRVLDFGVEGKTPFLVMSYAPNGTLRQQHPKGVILPIVSIVSYVKQVADALQYAHDEKLIHRDIKPENLLLGRRNELLLSDFGIALRHERSYPWVRFSLLIRFIPTVVAASLEQLDQATPGGVEVLIKYLENADPQVQELMVEGFKRSGLASPIIVQSLIRILNNDDVAGYCQLICRNSVYCRVMRRKRLQSDERSGIFCR